MFKCDNCKKVSNPKSKCFKVSIETRQKVYNHPDKDPTYGYETVQEQSLCAPCYEKYIEMYQEQECINKEQQEQKAKEQALQNVRTPIIIPRLGKISAPKFERKRRY